MTNQFSRIGKEKSELRIQLTIHEVEAEFAYPSEMSIFFERGPQRDESEKFPMGPYIRKAEL